MKQEEIRIGDTYYTYISGILAKVVVVDAVQVVRFGGKRRTLRFQVQRVGDSTPLRKLRSAAALRKESLKFHVTLE